MTHNERIERFLADTRDYSYLKETMSPAGLDAVARVIEAYSNGCIGIEIIRNSRDEIDFDKSFGFVLNVPSYSPSTPSAEMEVTVMRWYEGFEDTGYMAEFVEDTVAELCKGISDAFAYEATYKHISGDVFKLWTSKHGAPRITRFKENGEAIISFEFSNAEERAQAINKAITRGNIYEVSSDQHNQALAEKIAVAEAQKVPVSEISAREEQTR